MVLLAITPKGLAEALRTSALTKEPVWCGADAISEAEFDAVAPSNVTRFTYGLSGKDAVLVHDAIGTIAEHHPGQSIWVEATTQGEA